jgi:hypothetical protein
MKWRQNEMLEKNNLNQQKIQLCAIMNGIKKVKQC